MSMISYITIGTNDLPQALAFYDELFAEWQVPRIHDTERFSFYANGEGPGVMVTLPYDEQSATVGNGNMVALSADNEEQVKAVYAKAIALGATCEGEPGIRGDGISFGAYFRDPDGNKLAVMHMKV
ncbi:MAG: VOC family protein [Pseudomonadota bacterium]